MAKKTTSERRMAANRANAQRSTGPRTAPGKAKSSLNAVKTGLTGRTILPPSEDAKQYQAHVRRFHEELQPVGELETIALQNLADTQWRLNRIPGLEAGILALGRKCCAPNLFTEEKDSQVRNALLEAHVYLAEAQSLKNLHLQESRLRRQYAQGIKELERLRTEREKGRVGKVFNRWLAARKAVQATEEETEYYEQQLQQQQAPTLPNGFVFSNSANTSPDTANEGDRDR